MDLIPTEEVLRIWAQEKYGFDDIVSVDFEFDNGDTGCDTCGWGSPSIEVWVRRAGQTSPKLMESIYYTTDLINEIVKATAAQYT
jgi:hypothetical protein